MTKMSPLSHLIIVLLMLGSATKVMGLGDDERVEVLDRVEIDEELESGHLVVNLTQHIGKKRTSSNRTSVESIKFARRLSSSQSQQFQLWEYFQIETRRILRQQPSSSSSSSSAASQQHSSQTPLTAAIVLRASERKLDREYLCRLSSLRDECSCEGACLVWLDLIANDDEYLRLPLLVRDVNDNKPFFYSSSLTIELDLSSSTTTSNTNSSLVRIPLKEAIDLDSTAPNRISEYRIDIDDNNNGANNDERIIAVEYDSQERRTTASASSSSGEVDRPRLSLVVDLSSRRLLPASSEEQSVFSKRLKLSALDPNYTSTQTISLSLKLPQTPTTTVATSYGGGGGGNNHLLLSESVNGSSGVPKQSWLNHVYFVSAQNELDVVNTNATNTHQVNFRRLNRTKPLVGMSGGDGDGEMEQNLAYLIVEKSKFMSSRDSISIESEQLMDDTLVAVPSLLLLRVHEMRNGLYSISTQSAFYDLIKDTSVSSQVNSSTYTLRLTIRFNNLKLVKQLNMRVPSDLLERLSEFVAASLLATTNSTRVGAAAAVASSTHTQEQTSRRRLLAPLLASADSASMAASTNSLNLNLYNSVVVVSIASTILVVFGLACFSLTLLLYFTNKCNRERRKQKNHHQQQQEQQQQQQKKKRPTVDESSNIVVYDVPSIKETSTTGAFSKSGCLSIPKQTVYSLASSLSSDCDGRGVGGCIGIGTATAAAATTSSASSRSSSGGDVNTTTTSANNISPATTSSMQGNSIMSNYPISSSSSSSSSSSASTSSAGPLFQTHLETMPPLPSFPLPPPPQPSSTSELTMQRSNVFEWFMQQQQQPRELPRLNLMKTKRSDATANEPQSAGSSIASSSSPLSVSSTTNLIKTSATATTTTPTTTGETESSSISSSSSSTNSSTLSHRPSPTTLAANGVGNNFKKSGGGGGGSEDDQTNNINETKYKNDLYRSSHQIIYKQQLYHQQQQHQQQSAKSSPTTVLDHTDSSKPLPPLPPSSLGLLYEAKPVLWGTTTSSVSSTATLERDQMIDRLQAAIANLNNSMSSSTSSNPLGPLPPPPPPPTVSKNDDEIRQISCV